MYVSSSKDFISENSFRNVFIIGCARSGTTILFLALNSFKEVYLLSEDNPCISYNRENYRNWYNSMHQNDNDIPKIKGAHLPSFDIDSNNGNLFDYYYELSKRYNYVGSKYALGPHGTHYWNLLRENLIDFHANYFELASYIITLRRPDESIYSMHKMFPGRSFYELSYAWLKSLEMGMTVYFRFNNSMLLLHDTISNDAVDRIADYLKINKNNSVNFIGDPSCQDSSIVNGVNKYIRTYQKIIDRMLELYNDIKTDFNHKSMLYIGDVDPISFMKIKVKEKVDFILEDVKNEFGTSL